MSAFEEKQGRGMRTEQVISSLKPPVTTPGIKGHRPDKSLVFLSLSSLANLGQMQSCDLLEELGWWEEEREGRQSDMLGRDGQWTGQEGNRAPEWNLPPTS